LSSWNGAENGIKKYDFKIWGSSTVFIFIEVKSSITVNKNIVVNIQYNGKTRTTRSLKN
jgi:hypothetical protein